MAMENWGCVWSSSHITWLGAKEDYNRWLVEVLYSFIKLAKYLPAAGLHKRSTHILTIATRSILLNVQLASLLKTPQGLFLSIQERFNPAHSRQGCQAWTKVSFLIVYACPTMVPNFGLGLSSYLSQWELIICDSWVLSIVKLGYYLEFAQAPPLQYLQVAVIIRFHNCILSCLREIDTCP